MPRWHRGLRITQFGIVAPVGRNGVEELLAVVADPSDKRVPEIARACLAALGAQLRVLKAAVETLTETEPAGELTLKGLSRAIKAFNIAGFRAVPAS